MRKYFVTGSGRGIGKTLCEHILASDPEAEVIGISRSNSIEAERYTFHQLDLNDSKAVEAFEFPNFDDEVFLVNNAGVLGTINSVGKLDNASISKTIQVNLASPMVLCNKFMSKYSQGGVIANISTGAAFNPYESWAEYCSSKAGLEMFSQVMRKEQSAGGQNGGFEILSIQPGVVDTGMQSQLRNSSEDEFPMKSKFVQLHEGGDLLSTEEVAQALYKILREPDSIEDWQHRITRS